jgi:hypothetical protein
MASSETLKMKSTCKPWVTFYFICGHSVERSVKHRKQCKAVHYHSLPPNTPPIDFPLEQSQPETRQCKQLELIVTISHTTCSHCSTPSITPISQPLLAHRRTRWKKFQIETQNIGNEMAMSRFKARQERDAADKALEPLERQWEWVTELTRFREREVKKGVPLKDRIFVIERPHFINKLGKYAPTEWTGSGLLRPVDAGELINRPICALCDVRVTGVSFGPHSGQKLPCGHVFHQFCISKLMDWNALNPHCPNCKEAWEVHTYPKWEWPDKDNGGSWGPNRFRRFRSWIRWVREQDLDGEVLEFSDLDEDSDEETAEEHERLPCADGCGECPHT